MGALSELAAAADPSLAPFKVASPPAGEWEPQIDDPVRGFVFEAVYEAFQLHYGTPRAFDGMDPELRLLSGDALYALALERLAERGDLAAVGELADLITLSSVAQAGGQAALVRRLWESSAQALSASGGPGAKANFSAGRGRREGAA